MNFQNGTIYLLSIILFVTHSMYLAKQKNNNTGFQRYLLQTLILQTEARYFLCNSYAYCICMRWYHLYTNRLFAHKHSRVFVKCSTVLLSPLQRLASRGLLESWNTFSDCSLQHKAEEKGEMSTKGIPGCNRPYSLSLMCCSLTFQSSLLSASLYVEKHITRVLKSVELLWLLMLDDQAKYRRTHLLDQAEVLSIAQSANLKMI